MREMCLSWATAACTLVLAAATVACSDGTRVAGPAVTTAAPSHESEPSAPAPSTTQFADPPRSELTPLLDALGAVSLAHETGDGGASLYTTPCTSNERIVVMVGDQKVSVRPGGCLRCALWRGESAGVDTSLLPAFARAIRDYPPSFFRVAHVQRVALCSHIVSESGPTDEGLAIGGTVDHARGTLFLSLEKLGLLGDEILHHEVFHVFEMWTNPLLAHADPEWAALNPPGWRYGRDNRQGQLPAAFLAAHAMDNLREDQATVYQFAMARPQELCANAVAVKKARLLRARFVEALGKDDAAFLDRRAPCLATEE